MRPDRIGAVPISLADMPMSTRSAPNSNIVDLGTGALNRGDVEDIQDVNLVSPAAGTYGEVASVTYRLGGNYTGFRGRINQVSTGIFMSPEGIRGAGNDNLPFYMRVCMSAVIHYNLGSAGSESGNGNRRFCVSCIPVVGVRDPGQSSSTVGSDGQGVTLEHWNAIPPTYHGYDNGAGSNDNWPMITSICDRTLILSRGYGRYRGDGLDAGAIIGVGFMIRRASLVRNVDILENTEFTIHAWIYTADMDTYDPNRS